MSDAFLREQRAVAPLHGQATARQLQKHIWVSSTEFAATQTDSHVDTIAELMVELQELGQANAAPGSAQLQAAPYPTRLRPVTDLSQLMGKDCILSRIEFYAIDTTLWDGTDAGEGQNASVVEAVENSLSDPSDAYVASRFRNSVIGSWQPNWFRPEVRVNGAPVLFGLLSRTNFGTHNNPADNGWGLSLPYCDDNLYVSLGNVSSIQVQAQCAQYVEGLLQRYPVICTMDFYTSNLR